MKDHTSEADRLANEVLSAILLGFGIPVIDIPAYHIRRLGNSDRLEWIEPKNSGRIPAIPQLCWRWVGDDLKFEGNRDEEVS